MLASKTRQFWHLAEGRGTNRRPWHLSVLSAPVFIDIGLRVLYSIWYRERRAIVVDRYLPRSVGKVRLGKVGKVA